MRAAKENKNRVKPQGRTTTNAFPTVFVLLIIVGLICLLSVPPRFHQPANLFLAAA
jgi:CHASE3 domain sensor protein